MLIAALVVPGSITERMTKQWNTLNNKEEYTIDPSSNTNGPQKHYAESRKPYANQSVLHNPIYMKLYDRQI